MKIASKKPLAIKTNVYVTHDTYECWYAAPRSLGRIQKKGDYWYTADEHRHVSSRDALNYLIRLHEGGAPEPQAVQKPAPVQKTAAPLQKSAPQKPVMVPAQKVVPERVSTPTPSRKTEPAQYDQLHPRFPNAETSSDQYSQLHPRFQEYLDFLDYQARRKMSAQAANNL